MNQVLGSIPSDICSLSDYQQHAQSILAKDVWAYISGSAMDGLTYQRNSARFDSILLQQRILGEGLANGNCQHTILGHKFTFPLIIAPLAYQKLVNPMGELASIQAAAAQGVGYCLSTLASRSIEEVALAAPKSKRWFQLYFQPRLDDTLSLIKRAESSGYTAIVVTADAPINGVRNAEQREGFTLPDHIQAINLPNGLPKAANGDSVFSCWMSQAATWKSLAWLREQTQLPIILKGVMHPADALTAKEIGINGIIVSNHGGRVLDSQPASIEVLPRIRETLGADFPILLDSGIRRGSDIFKAIALGADAVLLGRPTLYALAVAGPLGVAHAIRILRDELEATMALCGCAHISDITSNCIYQERSIHL